MSYGMPSALNFRGLVGLRNSKNTEFIYGNSTKLCRFNPLTDDPGYRGQGYCTNLWEKYSYLGMSHAYISQYRNRREESLIAAGAPRDGLNGVVRLFTNTYDPQFGGAVTRQLKTVLTSPVNGAYFGFSIASCDVNGDGFEDLIVGAPYYSSGKYESNAGAIYVYLNHETEGFTDEYVFNATGKVRSLFGHSVACIGDIDQDGFIDFAVGAPYEVSGEEEDKEASGAVYIYRGNSNAAEIKQSQKVHAKDVGSTSTSRQVADLKGFGYSLSGGRDMDLNGYPDLVVGALQSSAVLVLRARPIVHVTTTINNFARLQAIDQKQRQCSYNSKETGSRRDAVCFPIELCIELDTPLAKTDLNFTVIAEPDSVHSRVFFRLSNTRQLNSTMRIDRSGGKQCSSIEVIFKKDNYDFVTPIEFLVKYMFANQREQVSKRSIQGIDAFPIVHEDTSQFKFKANFKTDCPNNECLSDLKLRASFVNLTVNEENVSILSFKESDSVSIRVRLENSGQLAYATEISVLFDERLDFIRKDDIVSVKSFALLF